MEDRFVRQVQRTKYLDVPMKLTSFCLRQVQMQFIRVVGQGRIAEHLANTPETVEFDKTFRRLRMYKDAVEALKTADKEVLEVLDAYTSGITAYEREGTCVINYFASTSGNKKHFYFFGVIVL